MYGEKAEMVRSEKGAGKMKKEWQIDGCRLRVSGSSVNIYNLQ